LLGGASLQGEEENNTLKHYNRLTYYKTNRERFVSKNVRSKTLPQN